MPNLYLFLLLLIWLGGFPLSDDVMLDPGWWQENINIYAHLSIVTLFLESIFSKECGNRYRMKQEKKIPMPKKENYIWHFLLWNLPFSNRPSSQYLQLQLSLLPIYPFSQHVLFKKELFQFVCLVIDCCLDDRFSVINLFELLCKVLNIIYWFLWRASAPLSSRSSFIMQSVKKHDILRQLKCWNA